METKQVDYHVRLRTLQDLEHFSRYIKDAVVERISHVERFTGIRLAGTRLEYNDWLHSSKFGLAKYKEDKIEVGNCDSALQVAGTIVHELGHMMVGHGAGHGPHWSEACKALGLLNERPLYLESDFTDDLLVIIKEAILRFAHDYPSLVYLDVDIPVPPSIGWADAAGHCTLTHVPHDDCPTHKKHVLDFQTKGVRWMLENDHNILLADEMGLGKTWTALLYINAVHPQRILIVCPNNAKLVWKRHVEELCVHKDYEFEVAHTNLYLFSDQVIMNYEAVVKHGDALHRQKWDLIILDEGHYVKNASAKRSKACYALEAKKKFVVTGTPIVNFPYELFPIIHWLHRDAWPSATNFERRFGGRGRGRFGYNLPMLNSILRETIMLRRFKKDVMSQLPKKRRQIVPFEIPDEIKPLIDEELELFNSLSDNVNAEQAQALAAMKNEASDAVDEIDWASLIESLQQTKRYAFERMSAIAHIIGMAKLPMVFEHIENVLENKEKVIVFGHHRDVLTAIAQHFSPNSVLVLGGNANQSQVTFDAADRFNNDPECRVFVSGISLAAAFSLQGSSTVIFVEETWVPGLYMQAEDRAHGIGRGDSEARSMFIQHLVFEDSLDTYKAQHGIKKQRSIERATGAAKRL